MEGEINSLHSSVSFKFYVKKRNPKALSHIDHETVRLMQEAEESESDANLERNVSRIIARYGCSVDLCNC
jgi:hypothetical protein